MAVMRVPMQLRVQVWQMAPRPVSGDKLSRPSSQSSLYFDRIREFLLFDKSPFSMIEVLAVISIISLYSSRPYTLFADSIFYPNISTEFWPTCL